MNRGLADDPSLRVYCQAHAPAASSWSDTTLQNHAVLDDFSQNDLAAIEKMTQKLGHSFFGQMALEQPSILDRRWWEDRIMAWAMRDESVKVQMFRFVDVLPMLTSSESVVRHLHEYFDEVRYFLPSAARLGMAIATERSIAGRALAIAARRNARAQARRFIAGTDTREVLAAAMRQRKLKRAFTLDVLGEAVTSQLEADRYLNAYVELIKGIAPTVNGWPEVPQIDQGVTGPLPRTNISVKLSALDSQFDPIDPQGTCTRVCGRLRQLLRVAHEHHAFVNIDMESYFAKDLTLRIFKEVFMEEEFRDTPDVGIVVQCYLKDTASDLVSLRDWAIERGTPVWVRLVKGAYWDYETIHASAAGWPIPVFLKKSHSDVCFEQQSRFLVLNHQHLRPVLASHNIRSLAAGIAAVRCAGLSPSALEIQMLYGMGDEIKQVMTKMGYRIRVYMPYGELIPGMAYLVRRLLENTSNDSFLRASFIQHISPEILLKNPLDADDSHSSIPQPTVITMDHQTFQNEPSTDFNNEENRQAMQRAIVQVRSEFGQFYPLVIKDQRVETEDRIVSVDPSNTRAKIGTAATAGRHHADQAAKAARQALPSWDSLGALARGKFLRDAAKLMRIRRFELAAWIVFESAKPWREADGDVSEAIDFCEYYAAGAIALEAGFASRIPRCTKGVPGEENRLSYWPRGVVAVIAPWNFPLAILTGMTTAALATGNTVVMKPAEQSPVIAAKLMDIFQEVGLPPGVLNYLPGMGEVAGAALVEHPEVNLIAFTGSRGVGMAINVQAAKTSASGSHFVKKVIAEMGGKNAIIVDADADLDEAVLGTVQSAFGYQGQKCSACSRAIVLESVYETFLQRLIEASRSLKIGPAEDPATNLGPVIDSESARRIRKYIELGRSEGGHRPQGGLVLSVDVGPLAKQGYFVGPHIFADVAPDARIAQEEIFGPVLAVLRAADLDEAIRIANGTDYALTCGIYSRSPANLQRACRELEAGNLYLNRSITGALVGRQPFGGFKMSGIGSKAGGPDYLLQFVIPRTVTENTMRRGFAPTQSDAPS